MKYENWEKAKELVAYIQKCEDEIKGLKNVDSIHLYGRNGVFVDEIKIPDNSVSKIHFHTAIQNAISVLETMVQCNKAELEKL